VNSPLDVKENDEHDLDFALHVSRIFQSQSLDFLFTTHDFFLERLSNHCQGLYHTFSEICTDVDAVPLSDPSQNCIRPDT
jgi:hypothetical protein